MVKTRSRESDEEPKKRSREEEEPRETKRQKSVQEAAKAKADAKALEEKFTTFVDNLEDGREDDEPKTRRHTEELVTRLTAVRQINCEYELTLGAAGICVLPQGLVRDDLSPFQLRKVVTRVSLRLAKKCVCGIEGLLDVHGETPFDKRLDPSGRIIASFAKHGDAGDWRTGECVVSESPTSKGSRVLLELARENYGPAVAVVDQLCALQAAIEAKAGRRVRSHRISFIDYRPRAKTNWHGDTLQGPLRSVLTWWEDNAEKRLMFGLAEDGRGTKPGHLKVTGDHYYLADLVLRPGDAYLGDDVAMGMRAVGRGEAGEYAIVHKVAPTACSQFVIIVDWVFV